MISFRKANITLLVIKYIADSELTIGFFEQYKERRESKAVSSVIAIP